MGKTGQQEKLEKAINMLVELGKGNFNTRVAIDDDDDLFNMVLSGLNMLAEELSYFRVELDAKSTLLEDTFSNVSEVVYAIRIDGTDLHSIRHEFISPRVKDLIGYTEDAVYKDSGLWFNSIHPSDISSLVKAIKTLFSGKEAICEYRIRHKSYNDYIWIEDRMMPKKASANEIQIFCCARDVTQRKKITEEREMLIRELSDKYNEMMQFNYIVSHNLRAPVASIIGACKLFQLELSDEEKDKIHGFVTQTAETLDQLIKDLNIILSTKSQLNEKYEVFNVSEVIEDIREMLGEQIIASNAVFNIDIAADAQEIKSIKSYFQSALYNLISNAIKYKKKNIDPIVNITIRKEQKSIHIQVSDNGIGIDMTKHGNDLFGLYKRFNTQYEGKGLGLHMTKVQIEALGGNITVKSKEGEGTLFSIVINSK
jgi:PAS domain S-box-containing protein